MTLTTQSKTKRLRDVFISRKGAIDLASIIVGVIVIGILGGIVAATIFAVIPWSQDNSTKNQLGSIVTAQDAYRGLSSDRKAPYTDSYAPDEGSLSDYGTMPSLKDASGNTIVKVLSVNPQYSSDKTSHFVAAMLSKTGKVFYVTDKNHTPKLATQADIIPNISSNYGPYELAASKIAAYGTLGSDLITKDDNYRFYTWQYIDKTTYAYAASSSTPNARTNPYYINGFNTKKVTSYNADPAESTLTGHGVTDTYPPLVTFWWPTS